MRTFWCVRAAFCMTVALVCLGVSGCNPLNTWEVRTASIPIAPSFNPDQIPDEPVAILPALSLGRLQGTEAGMSHYLGLILQALIPEWKVVGEHDSLTGINTHGLGTEYNLMRKAAEHSHLLERDTLRKIGAALGVRYIFQPRLAGVTQTMTNRVELPPISLRALQTRSSLMRMSLQLWETESGRLIWSSVAETAMANEAIGQQPVFVEDAVRVTFGSLMSDFLYRRTSSTYTPLNKALNAIVQEGVPGKQTDEESGSETKDQ